MAERLQRLDGGIWIDIVGVRVLKEGDVFRILPSGRARRATADAERLPINLGGVSNRDYWHVKSERADWSRRDQVANAADVAAGIDF